MRAEALRGARLIERAALPPAATREYYRADLVGFAVRNLEGVLLGALSHFVEAPARRGDGGAGARARALGAGACRRTCGAWIWQRARSWWTGRRSLRAR